jgi:hypothetical protein
MTPSWSEFTTFRLIVHQSRTDNRRQPFLLHSLNNYYIVQSGQSLKLPWDLTTPYKNTCFDYLLRFLLHGGTRDLTAWYKGQGGKGYRPTEPETASGPNYTIQKYLFRLPSSMPSSRWYKGLNCRVQRSELTQRDRLLLNGFFQHTVVKIWKLARRTSMDIHSRQVHQKFTFRKILLECVGKLKTNCIDWALSKNKMKWLCTSG